MAFDGEGEAEASWAHQLEIAPGVHDLRVVLPVRKAIRASHPWVDLHASHLMGRRSEQPFSRRPGIEKRVVYALRRHAVTLIDAQGRTPVGPGPSQPRLYGIEGLPAVLVH